MADRQPAPSEHGLTQAVVHAFLHSNLSLLLILLSAALGAAALLVTPREEDPQIVVPLADVYVDFPGHSAREVEQLAATPLERLLYQIDGVEYVYSQSRPDQAIITVRYYVGEDRERSLVKLYKRIDENRDLVPPGVTGWVVKPVEIDDVPIVTLTLTSPRADEYQLRRIGEELVARLAEVPDLSRTTIVGGQPRVARIRLDPDRMEAYGIAPLAIERAVQVTHVERAAGDFNRDDQVIDVRVSGVFTAAAALRDLVVGVVGDRPVYLKDVAEVIDGPDEAASYVRHGWGPAAGRGYPEGFAGTRVGGGTHAAAGPREAGAAPHATPAVTLAIAKKRGTNAVWVAERVLDEIERLRRDVVPDDVSVVVTRNYGHTANEKVNELIEGLAVAVFIVIALLTVGLGWREALIVAVAVPVVFGLTLAVNWMLGYTINRVTLFALILSLGLLVDDPIVDVENISRHFALRRRATRKIVMEAVAEIRPPLIVATLAVIVSFLPMFFITGMMGPYMRPMALNVPVTMLMSMLVAFTITPWLTYHLLRKRYTPRDAGAADRAAAPAAPVPEEDDLAGVESSLVYRLFAPLMRPLLRARIGAVAFLAGIGLLTALAAGLALLRSVPLKMLPFDNKNELLLVLDLPEGTTLERTDAAVRDFERAVSGLPELVDYVAYVGVASPIDFNGLVRHYYLRRGDNVAEIRLNLAEKKARNLQSHAIGLRERSAWTDLARRHGADLKIVEIPPGPPVLSTVTAEVYGNPDHSYEDLIAAAKVVRARLEAEPAVVDVDDSVEAPQAGLRFVVDTEKAALSGVSAEQIARTVGIALAGETVALLRVADERQPLRIELRLPRALRSSAADLARLNVSGSGARNVPLAELGRWEPYVVERTIHHKDLRPVVYVFAETAGRPPSEVVLDIQADLRPPDAAARRGAAPPAGAVPRPLSARTYLSNGGGLPWSVPAGVRVDFAGEGEWKITLDVFRDLGIAFGAALVGIYILLAAQMGSFLIPVVVMLAIPLTILGIMPGFWLLNQVAGGSAGGFADPIFFTATAMIGMIALAGIVTRQAVIIVDFIHLALRRGHGLVDAILASCVVRLRPILLTVGTAMLSALPIAIDPIFSGLAWALIFGLLAATLFTLFVIPTVYWLLYAGVPGHGVASVSDES